MNKALWDRLAALGGVVFVVLFLIGLLAPGSPPTVDDSGAEVVEFFTDSRGAILFGTWLIGLGVIALLWFAASLVTAMREAGEARLATAAFGGLILGVAIAAMASLLQAGLAYSVAGEIEPDEVRALYHLTVVANTLSGVIFAAFALAVAGATVRTGFLPRAWGWASGGVGLLFIVSATAWGRDGFWSPTGAIVIVVNITFVVWVAGTSVLHYREVSKA
jgi:hypothetical protein